MNINLTVPARLIAGAFALAGLVSVVLVAVEAAPYRFGPLGTALIVGATFFWFEYQRRVEERTRELAAFDHARRVRSL